MNIWSAIPAQIVSGHRWITLLTSMFMHGSWLHIIGNMIFLWAFGPEIEDAMGRWRYLAFYLTGGLVAMIAQVAADPHSTIPNLGASGAIAAVMGAFLVTYPRDHIRSILFIFIFVRTAFVPAALSSASGSSHSWSMPAQWRMCRRVEWPTWRTSGAASSGRSRRAFLKIRVESADEDAGTIRLNFRAGLAG